MVAVSDRTGERRGFAIALSSRTGWLRGAGALRLCEAQQVPARRVQIGQRRGHEQAMQVLFEAAVAHLGCIG